MKRIWRIMPEIPNTGFRSLNHDEKMNWLRVAFDDVFKREYDTKSEAEKRAESLARTSPGTRYEVYEVVSAYIVDGLRRETPGDLESVAKDRLEAPEGFELIDPPDERTCLPGNRCGRSDCSTCGSTTRS